MVYHSSDGATGALPGTVTAVAIIAGIVLGIPLLAATTFAITRLYRQEKKHKVDMSEGSRVFRRDIRVRSAGRSW